MVKMNKLMLFLVSSVLMLAGCTSQQLPDNWHPLTRVVERTNIVVSPTVVTTVSPLLITGDLDWFNERYPVGSVAHEALRRHEVQHAIEQEEYPQGKAAWFYRYLRDKDFRWGVEQRGYKEAILYKRSQGQWINVEGLAATLSGNVYNNMVSFEDARKWVLDVLAGRQ